jgi:hypothetical protein
VLDHVLTELSGRANVVRISRCFDRIDFTIENTSYYFDPLKPIARAADANISHAVAATLKIEAEDTARGVVVVKANDLFLTESFNRVTPLPDPNRKPHEVFSLGKLSAAKSKIRDVHNYTRNTDVVVEGEITDLSSTDITPYRDVINRWKLVKRDPTAAVSDPVEPIVYWIENTTPMELRPIIESAALRWNEAFEAAGFSNAVAVRTQPDDADWDAGDLRYNVIRWTSSPSPQFGGYGPSFFDPRTGQILGADIMLEHIVIANVLREARVLGDLSALDAPLSLDPTRCAAGLLAQRELLFANAALDALGADHAEHERVLEEFIYFLVLHEIGHTLGLNHNFRSSHLHSLEALYDPAQTYDVGLTGSVMDYPSAPFALPGKPQGQFSTSGEIRRA